VVVNQWRVNKVWRRREIDHARSADLMRDLACSPVLADLLVSRGIDSADDAKRFMDPSLGDLHDPDFLPGIDKAVERVAKAIRDNQSIAIVGDYDVDGLASTALLLEFFRFMDKSVQHYIPHRLRDGYGLNESTVRRLAEEGVELIITVDNGSTAIAAADTAAALGVDLVITDHHLPADVLPRAVAIVNPWLPDSKYPFQKLAGVGVAFKLVWALCRFFSRSRKVSPEFRKFMVESLALVALGTIADVMPLRDENRILTKFGLRALETTDRAGLVELVSLARRGDNDRPLTSEDVGFRMAALEKPKTLCVSWFHVTPKRRVEWSRRSSVRTICGVRSSATFTRRRVSRSSKTSIRRTTDSLSWRVKVGIPALLASSRRVSSRSSFGPPC
jgi:single-stranded-DNA-specific exonuclease